MASLLQQPAEKFGNDVICLLLYVMHILSVYFLVDFCLDYVYHNFEMKVYSLTIV